MTMYTSIDINTYNFMQVLQDLDDEGYLNTSGIFQYEHERETFCECMEVTTVLNFIKISDSNLYNYNGLDYNTKTWLVWLRNVLTRLTAGEAMYEGWSNDFKRLYVYLKRKLAQAAKPGKAEPAPPAQAAEPAPPAQAAEPAPPTHAEHAQALARIATLEATVAGSMEMLAHALARIAALEATVAGSMEMLAHALARIAALEAKAESTNKRQCM